MSIQLRLGALEERPYGGHRSWMPIVEYPYQEFRHRYGAREVLAEGTVLDAVPDILDIIDRVEPLAGPTP